ncbi:MAG: aminocarboxymuconate-semialdehyde decarboxylase [Candidatus Rokuibacteriota bacterium]|nr:MAG: aminocarboxymuconate-semialdehyde decarboxylase [Candidatus Rokubacteria bacterium]
MKPATIDVHAHYFPESFFRLIDEVGAPFGARVDRSHSAGPVIDMKGNRTFPLEASYWDLDRRRKAMDKAGVDVHALSLTAPMVYFADGPTGSRLARAVNDAMHEAHTAFPDRFVGCATLPMQDPTAAVAELERVKSLRGIRGVYLGTNINNRELSDPAFTPIFERCQAARLPVLLHPLNVIGAGGRLSKFYLNNFLGNPFDTAIAAAHLVFGGVLDRFPKLEVCLPHAGGALPYLMGRLTHGQRVRPETKGVAKKPFESYLRRFTYDTISHSPHLLRFLIDTVGADRVMLGSDYCFDMGYTRPVDIVTKSLVRLGRADQRRILGATASRLLRLG